MYNIDYALFIKKVKQVIDRDIVSGNTIVHFLSPFGIHSYSDLARTFNLPYIIGPIGGYLVMPKGFEAYRKMPMVVKELFYKKLLKNKKWQFYFENAKAIVCGTDLVAKHLPDGAKGKVEIIYDSVVDTEYFSPEKFEKEPNQNVTIVFTGRLVLYKGVFILAKAFERLSKKYPNIRLVYAGDGHERKSLEKFMETRGIKEKVSFTGKISRDQLKSLLLSSDIYCLPTLKDPGGNAILEAMSCGLPVISTNYGGPAYSVGRDCGVLIDPISIDDYVLRLSESLERLINDQDLRRVMGSKAREHIVNHFSSSELHNSILNFYRKALS